MAFETIHIYFATFIYIYSHVCMYDTVRTYVYTYIRYIHVHIYHIQYMYLHRCISQSVQINRTSCHAHLWCLLCHIDPRVRPWGAGGGASGGVAPHNGGMKKWGIKGGWLTPPPIPAVTSCDTFDSGNESHLESVTIPKYIHIRV